MSAEFPPEEFDSWADTYDQDVDESGFPFEGYTQVLNRILEQSAAREGMTVLDLGAGTGNLARLFHRRGCRLWCLDFSGPMLERLRLKLPEAVVARADIQGEWPPEFQRRYDRIVSAYTFHHFPLEAKVDLVRRLLDERLNLGGRLVIGDLAFENEAEKEAVRKKLKDEWDDEYYWLADETLEAFARIGVKARFTRVPPFAGVFLFGE